MATFFDPFDTLMQFQQALDSFRTSGWLAAGPRRLSTDQHLQKGR
jgi:hypothetical protein